MNKLSQDEKKKVAQDVWAFILGYYEEKGYMPTYEEIGDALGYSKQWAFLWVKELEKAGKLTVEKGKFRAIRINS